MVEISASQGQTAIFHGYVSRRRTWFEDFGNWKNREQAFRLTLALLGGQAPVFLRENPRISGKNCIAEGNRFHPAASKASQEDRRSAHPLRRLSLIHIYVAAASVLVAIAVFLLAAFGALVTFAPMGKLRASMAHSH